MACICTLMGWSMCCIKCRPIGKPETHQRPAAFVRLVFQYKRSTTIHLKKLKRAMYLPFFIIDIFFGQPKGWLR